MSCIAMWPRALIIAIAFAMAPPALASAQDARIVAQQRFDAGMAAFDAGRFDEAVLEFRRAYDAMPSPNSRLMLARSLDQAGRLGEAHTELDYVLREATDRAARDERFIATRDAATAELDALTPRVGWVTVHLDGELDDGEVIIEGRSFPPDVRDVRVPVTPGTIEVSVIRPGGEPTVGRVEVRATESAEITLVAPSRPEPSVVVDPIEAVERPSPSPVPWVVAGVGALGLGAALGLYLHATSLHDSAMGAPNMIQAVSLQAEAEDFALVTSVTLGIAAGVLVLGTVWGIIDLATLGGADE